MNPDLQELTKEPLAIDVVVKADAEASAASDRALESASLKRATIEARRALRLLSFLL